MNPSRPDISLTQVRESLYSAVVSDALDAAGYRQQSPSVDLNFRGPACMVVGRCRTTLWADMYHEDPSPYELELQAVDSCQPNDVIIAAAGGSMRSGIWGELLTTAVQTRGCVGAIVDGAVRDVEKIAQMDFPVLARGTCVYDSQHRQRVIDRDVPVQIGEVTFAPGDLVIADADGIVVVPQKVEQQVLQAAWQKVHAENEVRDAIRAGMSAVEAYDRFGVL